MVKSSLWAHGVSSLLGTDIFIAYCFRYTSVIVILETLETKAKPKQLPFYNITKSKSENFYWSGKHQILIKTWKSNLNPDNSQGKC